MSRAPRYVLPNVPLHITQRGNNRIQLFMDERDFALELAIIKETCCVNDCELHAYVLMSNHVHLLVTPRYKEGPSRMMQSMEIRYGRYFNKQNARTGTLWEGRFRSAVIKDSRYFLCCSRYIEMNPVRAGMVNDPRDYRWSSFHRNALGLSDPLITPHPIHNSMGSDNTRRCARYRALFQYSLEPAVCTEIRNATRACSFVGTPRHHYTWGSGRLTHG